MFHVSLLKKFEGSAPAHMVPLPEMLHGRVIPTLEKTIRAQLNKGVWELLVKWTLRSEADTTWEQIEDFRVGCICACLHRGMQVAAVWLL